jgi:ATP-dependent Clp protease ATP-binding subunit ClpB
LFDEIEKAHPEVFNILLQILDEGRLTDSKGRTVNFKNTVIIMTSNLGSDKIAQLAGDQRKQENAVNQILKNTFRPEFLNRVDDIIIFQPLTREDISKIVKLQLKLVSQRLAQKGIKIKFGDAALSHIASAGFDPVFGARPLKRVIQREILDELSLRIIEGQISEGDTVEVDYKGGKGIVIHKTGIAKS